MFWTHTHFTGGRNRGKCNSPVRNGHQRKYPVEHKCFLIIFSDLENVYGYSIESSDARWHLQITSHRHGLKTHCFACINHQWHDKHQELITVFLSTLTLHVLVIIIIIIILFVQNKMHIKHVNKISEQDNKALRSALTAALNTVIM